MPSSETERKAVAHFLDAASAWKDDLIPTDELVRRARALATPAPAAGTTEVATVTPFRLTCIACLWSTMRAFIDNQPEVLRPCPECGATTWTVQLKSTTGDPTFVPATPPAPAEAGTSTLERALALAAEAHAGQIDKAGEPYILHIMRVVLACPPGDARVVGALHDVVEDSDWTLESLLVHGFSPAVIDGVDAVTRRSTETYAAFVERAAKNELGRIVKEADVLDHLRPDGLLDLRKHAPAFADRYEQALVVLRRDGSGA